MRTPLSEINRCIKLFSDSQKAVMRAEQRADLQSVLFDVPRRSSLGWYCIYRRGYPLLRQLQEVISPEEIGRRMKRICSRPNYMTLSMIMCSYLGARQQRILDNGVEPGCPFIEDDIEQASYVVDFWSRACRSYRNDHNLVPAENDDTQAILDPADVTGLEQHLQVVRPEQWARVRRLAATLEIYAFILHGEQRDGTFAHGPYRTSDGRIMLVRDYTDLQNTYLPWATTEVRNLYPNVAIAVALEDVRLRFTVFGSALIEPRDYIRNLMSLALVTRLDDGSLRALSIDEVPDLERRAADAQKELYLKAMEWSAQYKIEYGVYLFANHMKAFFDIAGLDAGDQIKAEFESAAGELIEDLVQDPELPSIWPFMATTERDYFYPLVGR